MQPPLAEGCPARHEVRPCPRLPACPRLDCASGDAALDVLDGTRWEGGKGGESGVRPRQGDAAVAVVIAKRPIHPPPWATAIHHGPPPADMYFAKGYSKVVWRARYGGQDVVVKRPLRWVRGAACCGHPRSNKGRHAGAPGVAHWAPRCSRTQLRRGRRFPFPPRRRRRREMAQEPQGALRACLLRRMPVARGTLRTCPTRLALATGLVLTRAPPPAGPHADLAVAGGGGWSHKMELGGRGACCLPCARWSWPSATTADGPGAPLSSARDRAVCRHATGWPWPTRPFHWRRSWMRKACFTATGSLTRWDTRHAMRQRWLCLGRVRDPTCLSTDASVLVADRH